MDETVKYDYDRIIEYYFRDFESITKDDIDYLKQDFFKFYHGCVSFKIKDNTLHLFSKTTSSESDKEYTKKLYKNDPRVVPFQYMILETLKKYKIKDCEFVIYCGDAINGSNIQHFMKNDKILPILVTTSILGYFNMLLCPDFTFSFYKTYGIANNEKECKEVVQIQENEDFKNKINKMVWRGCGNTFYRNEYMFENNPYFDIKRTVRHEEGYLSKKEKSKYKYYLHLNGHEGSDTNGAYSSAFKWGLMNKSVVFYSAPKYYKEFWQHPFIFKEGEHFIFSRNREELIKQYNYILSDEDVGEKIANASFEFFKKYLLSYDNITYYVQKLLNEYSNRMTYVPDLNENDILVTENNYDI